MNNYINTFCDEGCSAPVPFSSDKENEAGPKEQKPIQVVFVKCVVDVEKQSFFHNGLDPSFSEDGLQYRVQTHFSDEGVLGKEPVRSYFKEGESFIDYALFAVRKQLPGGLLRGLLIECKKAEREWAQQSYLGFLTSDQQLKDSPEKRIVAQRALKYLIVTKEEAFFNAVGSLFKELFPIKKRAARPFPRELIHAIHLTFKPQKQWVEGSENIDLSRGAIAGLHELTPAKDEESVELRIARQSQWLQSIKDPAQQLIRMCRLLRLTIREIKIEGIRSLFSDQFIKDVDSCKFALEKFDAAWQEFVLSNYILTRNQANFSQNAYYKQWYEELKDNCDLPYLEEQMNNEKDFTVVDCLGEEVLKKRKSIEQAKNWGLTLLQLDSLSTDSLVSRFIHIAREVASVYG